MTDENIIGIDFEYHVETWFSDERRNPYIFQLVLNTPSAIIQLLSVP